MTKIKDKKTKDGDKALVVDKTLLGDNLNPSLPNDQNSVQDLWPYFHPENNINEKVVIMGDVCPAEAVLVKSNL